MGKHRERLISHPRRITMEENISTKLMLLTLERFDKLANLANVKASLVLPANAVLLVHLVRNSESYFKSLLGTWLSWFAPVSYYCIVGLLAGSVITSIASLLPYLKGGSRASEYCSLLFFGSISELDEEIYLRKVRAITPNGFSDDLGKQIHLLSKGLKKKFELCNWALGFFLSAFLLFAATAILNAIFKP